MQLLSITSHPGGYSQPHVHLREVDVGVALQEAAASQDILGNGARDQDRQASEENEMPPSRIHATCHPCRPPHSSALRLPVRSNSAEAPPAKSRRACARNSSGNPVPSASGLVLFGASGAKRVNYCMLLWTYVLPLSDKRITPFVFQIIIQYI